MRWQLQEAKQRFSEVVRAAQTDGAKFVTRRGEEVCVPDPVPVIDGLLAATAIVHDWTLVTRNVSDVANTGARLHNPFRR